MGCRPEKFYKDGAASLDEIEKQATLVEAAFRSRCPNNFFYFTQGLVIPSAYGPRLFRLCIADFQKECLEQMAPSIQAVRDGKMPPVRRFWLERTKKASKDSDIGMCLLWLTAFATRPCYFQVGAADQDQAAIVKRRISDLLFYNDWLNEFVQIQSWKILHRGGLAVTDILAADVAGSHGETPDMLIVNELSHVTRWEFVENLLDNATGVPKGLVIVATNAGIRGGRAEKLRSVAQRSKWSFHLWQEPAPWLSKEDVEEAKQRNLPSRFNRLYYGKWVSGTGDALNEDDITRCFRDRGPVLAPEKGWRYIAGIDLGVSHDHAGLVVLGANDKTQQLKVVWFRGWVPGGKSGEVDLIDVEETVLKVSKTYKLEWVGYDPSQAKLMAQRLFRRNVPVQEVSFASPKNLSAMATAFVQVVEAGKLDCYDDSDGRLRRDFGKLNVVERSYGYKLEAVSDEYGHADVGTALAICLPRAVDILSGRVGNWDPEAELATVDEGGDLSKEELEELPDELKDIYDAYDEMEDQESRGLGGWDEYGSTHDSFCKRRAGFSTT